MENILNDLIKGMKEISEDVTIDYKNQMCFGSTEIFQKTNVGLAAGIKKSQVFLDMWFPLRVDNDGKLSEVCKCFSIANTNVLLDGLLIVSLRGDLGFRVNLASQDLNSLFLSLKSYLEHIFRILSIVYEEIVFKNHGSKEAIKRIESAEEERAAFGANSQKILFYDPGCLVGKIS